MPADARSPFGEVTGGILEMRAMMNETLPVKAPLGILLGAQAGGQARIIITLMDKCSKELGDIIDKSLRVFTDAANHIPRHCRTSFFSHLMTVLGPKDFLAPLRLLLIEKSANKIARRQHQLFRTKNKDSGDAQGALALPTTLVHNFEPHLQVWVNEFTISFIVEVI
ncbi:hypothetical protein D9757_000428 [Collybiopsis confluens]|uniref:Utp10/HEAT1 HEAT-repeats domain-containing protein n=1 Tax=Collybiopsis confluens TaxID=2823264 RepID=A0A8H5I243_9AGAR|nr:hypothetical protein D9757_000428 [Collybiopsis confluens]